ncbi:hypothetical protein C5C03_00090 [Clavibacter michiganensis]|uniref:histone-like nucleoid-structuring protein Lsr2 n=1 Tax=Clavibacter michiganensis TaxID=28447 RepID=UPI000CE89320|nr:Lsr2 family protein [Clavibacter michiganensis]PPF91264.1 hypothetical protein C5C03_00090 [Clavibacter michiganensis]PPF99306.1 hypothetical protein C5C05_01895 [Clavibacter michiganensis]
MARKVTTTLVDDIDGRPIEEGKGETVAFAIDGVDYEIDLGEANAAALRSALQGYTEKGRPVGRTTNAKGSARRESGAGQKEDLSAARTWLRARGHKVSERGRISGPLLMEYRANN